ncbi:hydrolase [Hydrococcus rivularis NIES-593]|uniref:Hydrolase n=1 Tax=Hydrococcus rivularis NIES-593 TaxID=1921803 RepID=A0A1U7HNL1_9CYAN|nr:3-hydroxybutyrate oligomer hydrolase family protein [Hydrococcus rivularis]OKH25183.1 hydrolase [Hydrococcus rivularis NIES-593]
MAAADRINTLPSFVSGSITIHYYDGLSDDLLTAGVGQDGLMDAPPTATDPENPTPAEIRRATIINQYKALVDLRPKAGYGTLYGPAAPDRFSTPSSDGKVAGKEYIAYADDGSGQKNVTMMVQIPDNFDRANPCILVAPSPGSRGVYGAIAVGEWGLKNRCAVVYTDKGTGIGLHDLNTDTVNRIDGTRGTVAEVGTDANFIAQGTAEIGLATYNARYPFRLAYKHAHSQQNPEANWGRDVLNAIKFAYYILNIAENFGLVSGSEVLRTITPENTIVIASGISNGGAASLRAAEQDERGLINGVVVSEPNINPRQLPEKQEFSLKQGNKIYPNSVHGKPLFESITYYNIYQPCASAGTEIAFGWDPAKGKPENGGFLAGSPGRCTALRDAGLLNGNTLEEQIAESQKLLNDFGTLESTNIIAHLYNAAFVYAAIAPFYGNAYGRFSVVDNLCGYSYAYSDGSNPPSAKPNADLANDFSSSNGIPPSARTNLINNFGNNGAGVNFRYSVDANNNLDEYLQGALCLRQLATGTTGVTTDTGTSLSGEAANYCDRIQAGIEEILASGNLQGKPTIIIHGRDDALLHVNFTSRSYYGLNQKIEGENSQLAYIEVLHAHHLDALNQAFDIDTQIPLHYYLGKALDRMYDHLKNGTPLPKSQVIPTKPLASTGGTQLTIEKNLPDIDSDVTCTIAFSDNVLHIPECGSCS